MLAEPLDDAFRVEEVAAGELRGPVADRLGLQADAALAVAILRQILLGGADDGQVSKCGLVHGRRARPLLRGRFSGCGRDAARDELLAEAERVHHLVLERGGVGLAREVRARRPRRRVGVVGGVAAVVVAVVAGVVGPSTGAAATGPGGGGLLEEVVEVFHCFMSFCLLPLRSRGRPWRGVAIAVVPTGVLVFGTKRAPNGPASFRR